jgi:hypothetical protein
MTDQDNTKDRQQDKKISAEEALEKIKKIDNQETPPVKRENSALIIWVVIIALILLAFLFTYMAAPRFYVGQELHDSRIVYRTVEESSPGTGHSVKYTLFPAGRSVSLKIEYVDDYDGESADGAKPGKTVTGRVNPNAYVEFFDYLWSATGSMDKDFCSPVGGSLVLKKGKETVDICISPDSQDEISRKFKNLSDEFAGKVSRNYLDTNSDINLIAENLSPETALMYSPGRNALMYNVSNGELLLHHLNSNHTSGIGETILLASSPEGLVMVIKQNSSLAIWEKRMLHNNRMTLAEKWETSPRYQQVFVSDNSIYFTAPSKTTGKHDLIRFDYINYNSITLMESTDYFLKDMTADGEFLLLQHPYSAGQMMVVNGTGEEKNIKTLNMPDEIEYVFGFHKTPDEFVVVRAGSIGVRSSEDDFNALIQGSDARTYFPVSFNNNKSKMLYVEKENNIYHVLDLVSSTSVQVNKTPIVMSRPVFADNDTLYFTTYNDLLSWKPDKNRN